VEFLASKKHIARQLDRIGADAIRKELKYCGAWDDEELANDAKNRLRIVWIAAGNIRDEHKDRVF
jgi:hypothetical protein